MRQRKESRGPVFAAMRSGLLVHLHGQGLLPTATPGEAVDAALAAVPPPTDEASAIDLALSAGAWQGLAPQAPH